jgi:hypothetical protein
MSNWKTLSSSIWMSKFWLFNKSGWFYITYLKFHRHAETNENLNVIKSAEFLEVTKSYPEFAIDFMIAVTDKDYNLNFIL